MAITLKEKDHNKLDAFLGEVLDLYKSDEISKLEAIGAIAHVFTAAAKDNATEVNSWLHDPDVVKRWKSDIQGN
ncbi:hypothetical protein [Agrobacterium deltaense]|uniref:hypothetical protein n=1 Tax=Agrobacterium deltaense TaxID=1183412 RepID=UPI001C6ED9CC|nr:hypothetical protein [Agrobacterium deltaense]MBW9072404.1 hypothetical protein [Agrobacterium deltaense]